MLSSRQLIDKWTNQNYIRKIFISRFFCNQLYLTLVQPALRLEITSRNKLLFEFCSSLLSYVTFERLSLQYNVKVLGKVYIHFA
jgi:regulator of sigma D